LDDDGESDGDDSQAGRLGDVGCESRGDDFGEEYDAQGVEKEKEEQDCVDPEDDGDYVQVVELVVQIMEDHSDYAGALGGEEPSGDEVCALQLSSEDFLFHHEGSKLPLLADLPRKSTTCEKQHCDMLSVFDL